MAIIPDNRVGSCTQIVCIQVSLCEIDLCCEGATGPVGPTGPCCKGDTGADGKQGPTGPQSPISGNIQVRGCTGGGIVYFVGGVVANLTTGSAGPWVGTGWSVNTSTGNWSNTNNTLKLTINPTQLGAIGTAALINFNVIPVTQSDSATIGVGLLSNTFTSPSPIANPPLSTANTINFFIKGSGSNGFSFNAIVCFS